eukprot:3560711-Alexandrium_andersonii.AAC.1
MSASLVGSEMCIRDRLWAPWKVGQDAPKLAPGAGRFGPNNAPMMHAQAPVSYTHLTLPTICSV